MNRGELKAFNRKLEAALEGPRDGPYLRYDPEARELTIDGGVTLKQLEALVDLLKGAHVKEDARVLAEKVIPSEEYDEELFDLCRQDDYAGIYAAVAERIQEARRES